MKSINNFGSLVKNLNEENKNFKAPLKNFENADSSAKNKTEHEREEEYHRPTFKNSALENKQNNFKDLCMEGDVIFK